MATNFRGFKPKKLKPRTDMDFTTLRKEIFQHGRSITWEKAAACPCQRQLSAGSPVKEVNTREPRPDCETCDGKGYFYYTSQNIEVLALDAKYNPEYFQFYGARVEGLIRFTFLPEHMPGWLDKVTLLDTYAQYNDVLVKGPNNVEAMRYPIVTRSVKVGTAADVTESEVIQVKTLYVRKASAQGITTDEELVEDQDFVVTSDGKIDWSIGAAKGTAPAEGERYSVSFFMNPVYVVKSLPYTQRNTYHTEKSATEVFQELPVLADAWLEWLGD